MASISTSREELEKAEKIPRSFCAEFVPKIEVEGEEKSIASKGI